MQTTFKEIKQGTFFKYKDALYMKTETILGLNCATINLVFDSGDMCTLDDNAEVTKLDANVIYEGELC